MIQKQELVDEYKSLIQLCREYHLDEYTEKLKVKLQNLEEPLRFMIVGEGKSGKSTLLNALVGEEVAEVDDAPKTWCINVYYNTKEQPYAELVYSDRVQKVSVEEARAVSQRIGSRTKKGHATENILESDYQLQEIRWHLQLKWPKENILLIDTPGLGQDRTDTYCEKISIDGAEGIQYEAEDGFETFQYKADLLLWCFNAENTGDEIVERKLKSVPIDSSRIYGIVTRLDEHDENDREKLFQNCEKHYRKYLKQCLRSSLPSVADADTPKEVEEVLRMRKETIDSIRWCIEFLLKDNATLEVIKLESSAKYLEGLKLQIAAALKSYVTFYFENYQAYLQSVQGLLKEQEGESSRVMREVKMLTERIWQQVASDSYLLQLWMKAGENAEIYAELLSQQINNSGVLQQCDNVIAAYGTTTQELVEYAIDNIKWKDILIHQSADEGYQMQERKADFKEMMKVSTVERVSVYLEDMGLVYKLSQWAESAGFGSLIKAVAGGYLRGKAIEMGREAIGRQLSLCEDRYCEFIHQLQCQSHEHFSHYIEESFRRQTGQKPERIEDIIIAIEKKLTQWQWYEEPIPYYPYVERKTVTFFKAMYFPKLSVYQKQEKDIILQWLEDSILQPIFDEQRLVAMKAYRIALAEYTGMKGIQKPYCEERAVSIDKNILVQKRLPFVGKIEWGDMQEAVAARYEQLRSGFEQYCMQQWKQNCANSAKIFVKKKGDELQRTLQKEYYSFSQAWYPMLKNVVMGCVARKEFIRIPLETEYMYFYQYYYYPTHSMESTMLLVNEYEQTKQIPTMLLQKVNYVSPEGQSLEELFQKILKEMLDGILKQLYEYKNNIMQEWDREVNKVLQQVWENYEQGFVQLDAAMESTIIPAWKEYQINSASYGKSRIKDSIEYMRKSGKIPKQYIKLLDGAVSISEIGMVGYCTFSSGMSVYDGFRELLQKRIQKFVDKWR